MQARDLRLFPESGGEVTGEPEILVRDVAADSISGQAQVALTRSGTLPVLAFGQVTDQRPWTITGWPESMR